MRAWSDDHPGHHLVLVQIEPKDPFDAASAEGYLESVEREVLSVWPEDRVLSPGEVQGGYATLADAVETAGWPTLGETRGRVMFVVDESGEYRDVYTRGGAHWISTDFPAPVDGVDYVVEVPGGTPSRCNPITAPPDCAAADVEDPGRL